LLVLAGTAFLIIRDIADRRRSDALERSLSELDNIPESEVTERVSALLQQAANAAETQRQWLSVLARAVELAWESGTWEPARELSLQGARELPGNQALWAVAAYTTMRSGRDAAWIAREHLTADRYQSVRSEALLRATNPEAPAEEPPEAPAESGEAPAGATKAPAEPGDAGTAGGSAEPGENADAGPAGLTGLSRASAPRAFSQAYELTGDRRFLLDAGLRSAEEGALEQALQHFLDAQAYEPAVYTAYDLEALDQAQSLLTRLEPRQATSRELSLLRADILSRKGDRSEAARVYRETLQSSADAAPVAYHNLLWLSEIAGVAVPRGLPSPTQLTLQGSERFPGDTDLARIATVLLAQQNQERARSLSAERLQSVRSPGELGLLQHHLFRRGRPLSARFADLWQLWNEHQHLSIARYIGWLAVSLGSTEELGLIVRSAGSNRIPLYGGLYAMQRGERETALELFRRAAESRPGWQATANVAAILNDRGDTDEAIRLAEEALTRLDEQRPATVPRYSRGRAVLLYEKARALAEQNELERAFSTVEQSLNTDRQLNAARLLRRRLADQIDR
jgi:tetratricopeptide (TPR) repeat protein